MGYYSSYIIYVLPALILAMYAQAKVSSTFNKYSRVISRRGITAAEVAETILRTNGIYMLQLKELQVILQIILIPNPT